MSTAALLYLCTELRCLEITPDDKQFVLDNGSSLNLTCSGSGETAWKIKKEDVPDDQTPFTSNIQGSEKYQTVQSSATSTVLTLRNVSWKDAGVYQCTDRHTGETKEVPVFVPGEFCLLLTNNFTRTS